MSVVVKRALDLPRLDAMGKQDPFVIQKLLHGTGDAVGEFRTSTIRKGGTDPVWMDPVSATGRFPLTVSPGLPLLLRLEVFDEDVTANDFIGSGELDVVRLMAGGVSPGSPQETVVPLRKRDGKVAGQLVVAVSFTPGAEVVTSVSSVLHRLSGEHVAGRATCGWWASGVAGGQVGRWVGGCPVGRVCVSIPCMCSCCVVLVAVSQLWTSSWSMPVQSWTG